MPKCVVCAGLLEAATLTLPAMRNGRFCDTLVFETHHKASKMGAKGAKSGRGGLGGESHSVGVWGKQWCWRVMLLGISWGGGLSLPPILRDLRDPRKGKEHLPHPLWQNFTKLLPIPRQKPQFSDIKWKMNGDWFPTSLTAALNLTDDQQISPAMLGMIQYNYNTLFPDEKIELADILWVRRAEQMRNEKSSRTRIVHVGDDIRITWAQNEAYATVEDILLIRIQQKDSSSSSSSLSSLSSPFLDYLWLCPYWYEHPRAANRTNRRARMHPIRKTVMLERPVISESRSSPPVACEDIIMQVAVVHSCVRGDEGLPDDRCQVKKFCTKHKAELSECKEGCTDASASHRADWHNKTNMR